MSDIIERLRTNTGLIHDNYGAMGSPICLEAAAEIERLTTDRDRLKATLELVRDAVEWNNPETNGVLMRVRRALAEGTGE